MTWFEYGPGLTFQIYVPSAWCWWVWDMNVSAYAWFKALWIFGHVCLAFSLVILCFGWRGLVFSVRLFGVRLVLLTLREAGVCACGE